MDTCQDVANNLFLHIPCLILNKMGDNLISFSAAFLLALPIWVWVVYIPARRLWNTARFNQAPWRKANAPLIIMSAIKTAPDSNGYTVSRTGLGQVQALSRITPSLSRAYSDPISHGALQFAPSVEVTSPLLRDKDLVLIGGPKTNHITAAVLEKAKLSVEFVTRQLTGEVGGTVDIIRFFDAENGIQRELVTNGNEAFAFLAQFSNPFSNDSKNTITILAGSSTYGTELAALAFTDRKNLGKFSSIFRSRRGFVAVARGDLAGRNDTDRWVGSQKLIFIDTFKFQSTGKF